MLRKNVRNKFIIWMAVLTMAFSGTAIATAWAGDINSEESRVISVASGTFTYDGKIYRAKSSYINQLYAYLSKNGVDLTAAQADYVINRIYSSVEIGLKRGYIYEVKEKEEKTEAEDDPRKQITATEFQDITESTSTTELETDTGETGTTEKKETSSSGQQKTEATSADTKASATEGTTGKTEYSTVSTEKPSEKPTTEMDIDDIISKIEDEAADENKLNERVEPEQADISAVIEDDAIIIDTDDGEHIELDPSKAIIPESWTLTLEITAIASCVIAVITCLVLIATKCMRFRKRDSKKPVHGHRRRHNIRKVCRNFLLVTTGVSIAGLFLLIALFAALFNEGRIEKNIQDSGYFRYAYIQYLSDHGKALEGAEFLSDEEAAIISGTLSTAEAVTDETVLTYDAFIIREKQATQQLLSGNHDVEYQKGNVAPYILRIKEDMQMPMLISGIFFLVTLILGCVFTIFMDLRRDRGIKMLAISDLVGTAFLGILTASLLIWSPAKKLFIEPDYLYLFFKNYIDWIARTFAVISVFGLVLGMALFGVYLSRQKERGRR